MYSKVIHLPRKIKQAIAVFADLSMTLMATWGAFSLRLEVFHWPSSCQGHIYLLAICLALPIFMRMGLYRAVFRYTGLSAMVAVTRALAIYGCLFLLAVLWLKCPSIPRSIGILQPLLLFILIGSSRGLVKAWLNAQGTRARKQTESGRLLIYGAGSAGAQLASALSQSQRLKLIGFLDDDPQLQGRTINGQRVYAPSDIGALIAKYAITDILLALPSASRARRNEILEALRSHHVHVRSLPDLIALAKGNVTVSDIRELDIADLLGRPPVPLDLSLSSRPITGKVVLVTGAGGSIGSELCRQILALSPKKILLLEHSEFNLYAVHGELTRGLSQISPHTEVIPLLGSVCDEGRVREIHQKWCPTTVYHAAAYKHVPLVEDNSREGLHNNVFGTLTLARAAVENQVQDFVLVSTDKAVRPTNVMGASKRLAEIILQALASDPCPTFKGLSSHDREEDPAEFDPEPHTVPPVKNQTRFSMVRFGNVLGSSGSVVPLFRQQIIAGGPVTVTDAQVTRFFMTIPEAAQLVIQAGAMAKGGEVFVLDMGEPIKIIDLARHMIHLSGFVVKDGCNPHGDIEVIITGLRPGEKMYEELLIGNNPEPTSHPRIMKAHEEYLPWPQLKEKLKELAIVVAQGDGQRLKQALRNLVEGYTPRSFHEE